MSNSKQLPQRKEIRIPGYDYTTPGAYFLTICIREGRELFGSVVDGEMVSSGNGEMLTECWLALPQHFEHVALDSFILMPNHFHGTVWLRGGSESPRARHASPLQKTLRSTPPVEMQIKEPSLGTLVGSFKSAFTRMINTHMRTPDRELWQRGYFEHVIRNEDELLAIRKYIMENPSKWTFDRENRQKQPSDMADDKPWEA